MITVIQSQAAKLLKILTSATTLETYKQALSLTWTIIQETGRLLWLLSCAVLVGFAWLLGTSLWAGKTFRTWTTQLEQPSAGSVSMNDRILQLRDGFVTASKTSMNLALTTAMGQLGITETPKVIQDVMPTTDSTASSVSPTSLPAVTAPAPAPVQPPVTEVPTEATTAPTPSPATPLDVKSSEPEA